MSIRTGPAIEAAISGPAIVATEDGRKQPASGDTVLTADGLVAVRPEDLQHIVFAERASDAEQGRLWRDGFTRDLDITPQPAAAAQ